MSDYFQGDTPYELGQIRIQELHREREALRLAREAQDFHPGRIRTTLNQVVSLFKLLAFKLEKRFAFGHTLREKVVAVRHQTSLRSTHFGL